MGHRRILGEVDDKQSLAALNQAIDCGINCIDTADIYGLGRSERPLAQLKRDRREEIIIATKAGRRLPAQTIAGYSRENLTVWVEESLRNFATASVSSAWRKLSKPSNIPTQKPCISSSTAFAFAPQDCSSISPQKTNRCPPRRPTHLPKPDRTPRFNAGKRDILRGTMNFIERLLPEFDTEFQNARKMLEVVPEDKFAWKPHAKSMTLGRLAGHVAEMPNWALVTIQVDTLELKGGQQPFRPASRDELLSRFDENVLQARQALQGLKQEQLEAIWRLKFGDKTLFEMPRAAVLRTTVMNHMIHHRGQLSVYLRLLDVHVPGMYGPSADEMSTFMPQ